MKTLFMKFTLILMGIMAFSFVNDKPGSTMDNLQEAYNDEANAVKKYELYSVKASEEGYKNVANLFRALAKSESIHMENHKKAIEKLGGKPQDVMYNKVIVKSTKENLRRPINNEEEEAEVTYPEYINVAREENAKDAVKSFTYAMSVEKAHEMVLNEALANLGHNLREDYYVSDVTGEMITAKGTEPAPKAKLRGEKFIKVK